MEFGGWRSKSDDIKLPSIEQEIATNEKIEISTYEHTEVEVKDEYNTDEIIEVIKKRTQR